MSGSGIPADVQRVLASTRLVLNRVRNAGFALPKDHAILADQTCLQPIPFLSQWLNEALNILVQEPPFIYEEKDDEEKKKKQEAHRRLALFFTVGEKAIGIQTMREYAKRLSGLNITDVWIASHVPLSASVQAEFFKGVSKGTRLVNLNYRQFLLDVCNAPPNAAIRVTYSKASAAEIKKHGNLAVKVSDLPTMDVGDVAAMQLALQPAEIVACCRKVGRTTDEHTYWREVRGSTN